MTKKAPRVRIRGKIISKAVVRWWEGDEREEGGWRGGTGSGMITGGCLFIGFLK